MSPSRATVDERMVSPQIDQATRGGCRRSVHQAFGWDGPARFCPPDLSGVYGVDQCAFALFVNLVRTKEGKS